MEKTAQQTSEQGTLVGENRIESVDNSGGQGLDTPTITDASGSITPQKDSAQRTHGQETYPGVRQENVTDVPGENPPEAGDVDSASTKSATVTGQDGDLTKDEKKKAFRYN